MEKYNKSCLRTAHKGLDMLDPVLIGILNNDKEAETILAKQVEALASYMDALNIKEKDNKSMRDFTHRVENFRTLLEVIEEQGHSNLVVARIIRALCRKVINPYVIAKTNLTAEEFYIAFNAINNIKDEEDMKASLIGELQTLGFSSGLFIPLTRDGFEILKEVIEGNLNRDAEKDTVNSVLALIERYEGLHRYTDFETLDDATKEEVVELGKRVEERKSGILDKHLSLFNGPVFK
ncbi:hypothetical protein UT300012_22080 [Paraclostridium bifermentans]